MMAKDLQDESYGDFVAMYKNGRPTKADIEKFDRKYGSTRRGQCKEIMEKRGRGFTTKKWPK